MKRVERRTAELLLIIATAMIIVMAVGAVMAHAATKYLTYGQCITVRGTKYCAPQKNICPVPTPCPVCPTPKPCPTSAPCPQPTPCPGLTSDTYWYAIASMFLSCGSTGTGWNLGTADYITKLSNLTLAQPEMELTVSGCYVRMWTNAMVILNPQDAVSCTIPLEGMYKNVETGASVSGSIAVGPKRGKVLVR